MTVSAWPELDHFFVTYPFTAGGIPSTFKALAIPPRDSDLPLQA
jgi:hypothetical protein